MLDSKFITLRELFYQMKYYQVEQRKEFKLC